MPEEPAAGKPRRVRRAPTGPKPPRRHGGGRGARGQPPGFRERLRKDRVLFAMCLGFLAFTTWAFAISWRLLGDRSLLGLTVLSILPAFYLFYLRDTPAA